jgi:hypothetical protein
VNPNRGSGRVSRGKPKPYPFPEMESFLPPYFHPEKIDRSVQQKTKEKTEGIQKIHGL